MNPNMGKEERGEGGQLDPLQGSLISADDFRAKKQSQDLHVVGVVGFSGQWDEDKVKADPELRADVKVAEKMLEQHLLALREQYGPRLVVSSGATMPGVPGIVYKLCDKNGIDAMGVACSKAADYELGKMKYLIIEGDDWGAESKTFLDTSDEILMLGGGGQAKREAQQANGEGKIVTVFQGFKGTADELNAQDLEHAVFVQRSSLGAYSERVKERSQLERLGVDVTSLEGRLGQSIDDDTLVSMDPIATDMARVRLAVQLGLDPETDKTYGEVIEQQRRLVAATLGLPKWDEDAARAELAKVKQRAEQQRALTKEQDTEFEEKVIEDVVHKSGYVKAYFPDGDYESFFEHEMDDPEALSLLEPGRTLRIYSRNRGVDVEGVALKPYQTPAEREAEIEGHRREYALDKAVDKARLKYPFTGVLEDTHFNREAIDKIRAELSEEPFTILDSFRASHVSGAITEAHELAQELERTVALCFNGDAVIVRPDEEASSAYQEWERERLEERKKYEALRESEVIAEPTVEPAPEESAQSVYEALPPFFKSWVDSCGDKNYGFELDVRIAKDAALVAEALESVDAIKKWARRYPSEDITQIAISDQHSGFSFSQMISLAAASLKQ